MVDMNNSLSDSLVGSNTNLLALHVNSTKPFIARNGSAAGYKIEDFDILTTILSALLWRKYNGKIKLYTDSVGFGYYRNMGILDLWNGGVDVDTLDNLPKDIRYDIFWASSKIYAIRKEKVPFVMMDTDMLVWKPIHNLVADYKLAAFHEEDLCIDCYLPLPLLKRRSDYLPDKRWNWRVLPCNTALTYFNDPEFLSYYTNEAIYFMRDNKDTPMEFVSQMVFAEQRIFSMCADVMGIDVYKFLSFPEEQAGFTHIWGLKTLVFDDKVARKTLCRSLCEAIDANFPDYSKSDPVMAIFDEYFYGK